MPLLTTRKFLAEVVSIAEVELKRLGFRKVGGAYTHRLNDDTLGWVGLNTIAQRSDGRVGINPVVGVINAPVEAMLQELTGVKESSPSPTLSTSLGYVTPDGRYQEWLFEPAPFAYRTEVSRLVFAVERHGIPFMQSKASLDEIILDLEQVRFTSKESVVFRLPITYALSGNVALAVSYVQEHLKEIEKRSDLDAQRYRDFSTRFVSRFT